VKVSETLTMAATMAELKESSLIDAVLSLDVTTDNQYVLLTLHFESDTSVLFPMSVDVAMRIWALLDEAKRQKGWSAPATPVLTDQMQ
jgi:hypothetical protein